MSHTAVNADPDALLQCPYDPVHMIAQKRMPYHLIKCRKNHRVEDYEQCPYDARHIVPKDEFENHITNCKMKAIVEPTLILGREEGIRIPDSQAKIIENRLSSEWDSEAPTSSQARAAASSTSRSNTFVDIPTPPVRADPNMVSFGRGRGSSTPQIDASYETSASYAINSNIESINSFITPKPLVSIGRGQRSHQDLPRPRRPYSYDVSGKQQTINKKTV